MMIMVMAIMMKMIMRMMIMIGKFKKKTNDVSCHKLKCQ
jgi:hypothetical protein